MKKIAFALALVLAGSSLVVGLASTDANAGARKVCKQGISLPVREVVSMLVMGRYGHHRNPR